MMRIHRSVRFAILAFAAAAAAASATTAQAEWLTVTDCELVTIDGHEYGKITFDIRNNSTGIGLGQVFEILLRPYLAAPDDTCHLVETSLPVGWVENSAGYPNGWHSWNATSIENALEPGESLQGIQVVISQPVCCYTFQFPGPLLLGIYPVYPVCFACPGVTPARESTWGRVKQTYR